MKNPIKEISTPYSQTKIDDYSNEAGTFKTLSVTAHRVSDIQIKQTQRKLSSSNVKEIEIKYIDESGAFQHIEILLYSNKN